MELIEITESDIYTAIRQSQKELVYFDLKHHYLAEGFFPMIDTHLMTFAMLRYFRERGIAAKDVSRYSSWGLTEDYNIQANIGDKVYNCEVVLSHVNNEYVVIHKSFRTSNGVLNRDPSSWPNYTNHPEADLFFALEYVANDDEIYAQRCQAAKYYESQYEELARMVGDHPETIYDLSGGELMAQGVYLRYWLDNKLATETCIEDDVSLLGYDDEPEKWYCPKAKCYSSETISERLLHSSLS